LDALSCRSFPAREPLILALFCGKRPTKIRHPMGLCHPVVTYAEAKSEAFTDWRGGEIYV